MTDTSQLDQYIKVVADGYLREQGHNPTEVYAFLKALEGAPDITDVAFGNFSKHVTGAVVTAEYIGSDHWGGTKKIQEVGAGLACDEFQTTAETLFEAIAEHTGYVITDVNANTRPDNCSAKVNLDSKVLRMVVKKSDDQPK